MKEGMIKPKKGNLFNDFVKHFSTGQYESMKTAGLDMLEGRRKGSYIYDEKGARYIDCVSGAATFNLGRRHPEITGALQQAIRETDQGNFVLLSQEKARLAKRLTEFVPGDFRGVYFSVARGEAMDFACKLARGCTGRPGLVTVDGGYYGETGFAMSISERSDSACFGTLMPGVRRIPYGNFALAKEAIGKDTAAVIVEPVQAENHCRTAFRDYYRELRRLCDRAGAQLVFDETQTGMGRTGKKFAYEYYGMEPDILVIGESLAAGVFPITATVYKKKLLKLLNEHPLIHLSTFGGHDVGCRVAMKALEVYERTRPWENALLMSEMLKSGLLDIRAQHPELIRSVAGMGLLLSLGLPTPDHAAAFCRAARNNGVLVTAGIVAPYSVVIRPPLTISTIDVKAVISALAASARKVRV